MQLDDRFRWNDFAAFSGQRDAVDDQLQTVLQEISGASSTLEGEFLLSQSGDAHAAAIFSEARRSLKAFKCKDF